MTSFPTTPARRRPTTWLAVALLVLALAMVGFVCVSMWLPGSEQLGGQPRSTEELATFLTQTLAFITLPTVGALLIVQRPRNSVGWILLASGVGLASGAFANEYVRRSVALVALPAYELADWLGFALQSLGFLLLVIWLPLVFPDGRLPGPRWRPIGAGSVVFVAGAAAVLLFNDRVREERLLPIPVRVEGTLRVMVDALDLLVTPLLVAFILLAFASLVVRFQRSRGAERQQLKWFLAAVVLLVATVLTTMVTGIPRQGPPAFVAFTFLPVAVGIAILRYRLYEIDRLISRTIGWAMVTWFLAGAFALLVLGLQPLLQPLTGGDTLAIAASTLVVAASFNPVRTMVQGAVDRRFDRSRYDGDRMLAAFGERLRDEVDLPTISANVLATFDAAVRPTSASLWLRETEPR